MRILRRSLLDDSRTVRWDYWGLINDPKQALWVQWCPQRCGVRWFVVNEQDVRDLDFLVVCTVEEYGRRHLMETDAVLKLFDAHGAIGKLRSQYAVLHTLDPDESCDFVEGVLRHGAGM